MNQSQKRISLSNCPTLASASEADLEWLAERALVEQFDPDQVVFVAGETSTRVFIVAEGALQVRLGESCKLVSFAEKGALFGEYAMFAKGVRTAHVVASDECTLLSFKEEDFKEFLLRCPTVMMELLQTAVRRLHRVERQRDG